MNEFDTLTKFADLVAQHQAVRDEKVQNLVDSLGEKIAPYYDELLTGKIVFLRPREVKFTKEELDIVFKYYSIYIESEDDKYVLCKDKKQINSYFLNKKIKNALLTMSWVVPVLGVLAFFMFFTYMAIDGINSSHRKIINNFKQWSATVANVQYVDEISCIDSSTSKQAKKTISGTDFCTGVSQDGTELGAYCDTNVCFDGYKTVSFKYPK